MKDMFQYELCLVNVLFNFLRISVVSCASVFSVPMLLWIVLYDDFSLAVEAVNYTKAYFGYDCVAMVNPSLLSNIK